MMIPKNREISGISSPWDLDSSDEILLEIYRILHR